MQSRKQSAGDAWTPPWGGPDNFTLCYHHLSMSMIGTVQSKDLGRAQFRQVRDGDIIRGCGQGNPALGQAFLRSTR